MARIARYVSVAGAVLAAGLLALSSDRTGLIIRPEPEPPPVPGPSGRPTRLNVVAASDERLIDRETGTSVTLTGPSDLLFELEQAGWISSIKTFGPADGTIAVLAETSSGWQPVPGLTAVPLSGLAAGWNELAATQPVFAAAAIVRFTPGAGSRRAMSEIELWGPAATAGSNLRPLAASTAEISVTDREVSVPLSVNASLSPYRRVYLTYELRGWQEWVSVSRSINDGPESGTALGPLTGEWTPQVEEINPAWLRGGANAVRFAVPSAATLAYDVRNVQLVGEVDTGRNAVDGTDIVVLHSATGSERVETMTLDEATQVSGIDVDAPLGTTASPRIEALIGDAWETIYASSSPLAAGWSYLPLNERRPVSALRFAWADADAAIEAVPVGSVIGSASSAAIRVSYPTDGRYYGREAHLRGFLVPASAEVWIAGTRVDRADGSFAATVSKDDLGLFDEADATPWTVQVRAVYPNGRVVLRDVALNAGRPGPESLEGRLLPARSLRAEPNARKRMTHDAATLDVDAGSVDSALDLSITPLGDSDLPALDQGMTNVTRGPRRGYRFQPHGMRFKKAVRVELPYDAQLIPAGLTENDIRTFYFDEQTGRWMELDRVEVDAAARKVVSRTDHFTDMINATITVPDHPSPLMGDPNAIKDIKAADPGERINLIEPPKAGHRGDAKVSFPIDLPPGRLGIAPQLELTYDSSKDNGWLGVGWDLAPRTVTIDTRWGVPRYDAAVESETYLLEGEQLTPGAHREPFRARAAEASFRTRVERDFRRIVRHGDAPSNYWWEVTDKSGVRYLFTAKLTTADGSIFSWALTEVRDPHGNGIQYAYDLVTDPGVDGGAVPGYQLYLRRINYTQRGATPGAYTVTLKRDSEMPGYVRRPDVPIDARGGFKMVTAELLRRIEVDFDDGTGPKRIRSYDLNYVQGAFAKTLLESVTQRGTKEQAFHTHRFTYYDDVRQAGAYVGFHTPESWQTGSDDVRVAVIDDLAGPLGLGDGRATALSGYETTSIGTHVYVGFNEASPTKQGSKGFKYGAGGTVDSSVLLTMLDLNGDRLPDKVFRQDDDVFLRLNQSGPHGGTVFGPPVPVGTLSALGRESTFTTSFGIETYVIGSVMTNIALSFTNTPVYFADANGDGLPDLIDNGTILFNRLDADGTPTFDPDSSTSPVPVALTPVDGTDLLPDYTDVQNQALASSPLQDTVRRWIAPFAGTVSVTGDVVLHPPEPGYRTADGVRVAIQHNGTELWSETIDATDGTAKSPENVDAISVVKGDRIYFRVHSRFDGRDDVVDWDPSVTYVGAPVSTDVNLLDPRRFQASTDFTMAGRRDIDVKLPFTGKVHVSGTLHKTGATTDDVTLLIKKAGVLVMPATTLTSDQTGDIPIDFDLDVTQDERLQLRVKVDSPIDLGKIEWVPTLHYLANPLPTQTLNGTTRTITRVFDAQGNPIIRIDLPYDIDAYPVDTLFAPQSPFVVPPAISTITARTTLAATAADANGVVVFTAKKRGVLLSKQLVPIVNGVVGNVQADLGVQEDDEIFFDYSVYDPDLAPKVSHRIVEVRAIGPDFNPAPSAFRHAVLQGGVFPQPYRGWAVAGYKGDPPRGEQPIVESDLDVTFTSASSFDSRTAKAFLYAPAPALDRWVGPEDQTFVAPGGAGSSRIGVDFVQAPTATAAAGAAAPSRISASSQTAVGGGGLFLSGSASTGNGGSDLDFLDMNGDQFPDVVGNGRVQYTSIVGGLEAANRAVGGFSRPRETTSDAGNVGVGGSPAEFKLDGRGRVDSPSRGPSGKENGTGSQMVTLGLGGSLGSGSSQATFDLMDVNGDGLPDRVAQNGSQVMVALNLGYGFAPAEGWGTATLNVGDSENSSVGPTLGFNGGIYDFAGGVSFDRNSSEVPRDLLDVNGDGKPDRLTTTAGGLMVGFNTGAGFLPDVPWSGAPSPELATSATSSVGAGAYFTVGIGPLCLFGCYVIVNPGADGATALARQETTLNDVDGDGYPDHLASDRDDTLTVARNTTGRTNLLRRIERPMRAVIDLDYAREGNTYDEPQSRWVLSRVDVFDGLAGDGADRMLTTYRYEGGVYDRLEREFYGFGKVVEEQRDTAAGDAIFRSTEREYATGSYYTNGLMTKETLRDGAGRPFIETENTYALRDESTATPGDAKSTTATEYPQLARVDKRYFEGRPAPVKATFRAYEYDAFGNTTRFLDAGDTGPADDVEATATYLTCAATHIVGRATALEVKGNGQTMRRREATVDCATGDVGEVREYLESGSAAVTDIAYFAEGTLREVTGPVNHRGQRYTLAYTYDPVTGTHVASVLDSFGLRSTATHDLRFGQPSTTTDVAGNVTSYAYDAFGRTASITGVYEQGTGAKTIRFEYHPEAAVPYAHTRHLDPFRSVADTIDTVLFTDGLGRAVQLKKDAALHRGPSATPSDVMIVSGRVIFDAFGRTTSERYPITEALGTPSVFNPAADSVTPTTTAYDVLDRVTEVKIPDGTRTTTTYGFGTDRAGRTQFEKIVTDANGIVKRAYSDVRELLIGLKETNRGGAETIWTSYDYDPLRQISAVTDDRGNVTRVLHDNLGRRTAVDSPDMGKFETVYDLASNAVARITPNLRAAGKRIQIDYDFLRRVAIHYPDFPGNDVAYLYGAPAAPENAAGRVTSVTDESGRMERGYGKLGEIVRETRTVASDTGSPDVYTTRWVYDTFGRLQNMTYPDGEKLTYAYDSGGLVRGASGVKGSNAYAYANRVEYDKFGERAFVETGNGVKTAWAYRADNRRLDALSAVSPSGRTFQNLRYAYDPVGNVLRMQNVVTLPPPSSYGGPTDVTFGYDDLYRLTASAGTYQFSPSKSQRFALAMDYDTIHNIVTKSQSDAIVQPSGQPVPQKKTSYAFTYAYASGKPHAATHVGERTYAYDANGNQTGWTNDRNGTRRTIVWDEENRIQTLADNGHTESYKYDDTGTRLIKRGPQGETVYVNPFFTVRNREIGTKHILVGEARLVSKLVKAQALERDLYFYHSDHLGSSHYVTDAAGQLYEHQEYFPYGEAWIEEQSNTQRTPYRFTAKELDEETGLYDFGARYYDPRTSVWQSPDPLLDAYLPSGGGIEGLPGRGGVFDPSNLALYTYAGSNPLRHIDRDGRDKASVEKIAKALDAEMNSAWKASFKKDGSVVEQGSAIVLKGKVVSAKQSASNATEGNVHIDTTVDAGEKLIGTFHTHPFSKKEGAYEGVAHSQDDLEVIKGGTKGRYTFIEAGSKRFALETVDPAKFKAFMDSEESVKAWYGGFGSSKGSYADKRFAAIRGVALHKASGLKLYQTTDASKVKFEEVK